MTNALFEVVGDGGVSEERIAPGAVVLRGYALPHAATLLAAIGEVSAAAPFHHMVTPGGFRMSAAMTNCGALDWVTDLPVATVAAVRSPIKDPSRPQRPPR